MSQLPLVVAVAGDAGGAYALAPVIQLLIAQGAVQLRAFAYRQARTIWRQKGIGFEDLDETKPPHLIVQHTGLQHAGLLLVGTSDNGIDFERHLTAAARHGGVPSVAVLDFWSAYAKRFSDENGALRFVPDRVAVMDERAREQMIAAGHEAGRIVVTGQPQFDDLPDARKRFGEAQRSAIRAAVGATNDEKLVVFASQPIAEMTPNIGYNERTVLLALVAALDAIAAKHKAPITLWIRPHPRENTERLEQAQSREITIRVSNAFTSDEAVLAADLVTGMTSMLLMEACYLGCVVASLQPGLSVPDALPANDWGWSRGIYSEQEIGPALATLLFNESERAAIKMNLSKIAPQRGATKRVAWLACEMLGV